MVFAPASRACADARLAPSVGSRVVSALGAAVAAALALFLAAHHPVAPVVLAAAALAWGAVMVRWPQAWLVVVPAAVPWLDFAPWTGWMAASELDVLLLATLAGGHARRACAAAASPWPAPRTSLAFAALALLGLARGLLDAPSLALGWHDDAFTAANTLRVSKALLYVPLWAPLLADALERLGARALPRLLAGGLVGLAVVAGAATWERATFPGLLDMAAPYRSTGLFWEMHVGGAAIDAWFALTLPLVAWGLARARCAAAWLATAVLALVATYAALTTFARGVYLAAAVAMLVLGGLQLARASDAGSHPWRRRALKLVVGVLASVVLLLAFALLRHAGVLAVLGLAAAVAALRVRQAGAAVGWRGAAGAVLALMLLAEAVTVFGPDSYMGRRVLRSPDDYGSRLAHWQRGIDLLRTPADWLLGLGAGRLPSHYAAAGRDGVPAGRIAWLAPGRVSVEGPARPRLRHGSYALSQRVPAQPAYRLAVDATTTRGALVHARVCEGHLLYDRACQRMVAWLPPMRPGETSHVERPLLGPALARPALFMLSVENVGGALELHRVSLSTVAGTPLLGNPALEPGRGGWLPVARHDFLPWHIDNLALEWLIERGLVGLAAFVAVVGVALHRVTLGAARQAQDAPYLAAALCGVLTLGLVSSVLDVPRVTFAAGLLLLAALQLRPAARRTPTGIRAPSPAG